MNKLFAHKGTYFWRFCGVYDQITPINAPNFKKNGDCTGEVLETPYFENGKFLDPSLTTLKEITARYAEVSILSDDINEYLEILPFSLRNPKLGENVLKLVIFPDIR